MFEFDRVSYQYADTVGLDEVSFTIDAGDAVAIMGPNGSGKSTLFKLMCGLLKPTAGTYTYQHDAPDFDQLRQTVGFVFQNSDVQLFNETVTDELAFGPLQLGLSEATVQQRVADVIDLLGLAPLANRVPYQLSGGEQKLVALGSVLTMNPQTIILDEPFNGLAISYQNRLIDLLNTLHAHGKTIIMSSHDFAKTVPMVDRIVTLNENHQLDFATETSALTVAQEELLNRL